MGFTLRPVVGPELFALAVDRERQWTFAGDEKGRLHLWDENGKRRHTAEPPTPEPLTAEK